jgi:hypothetical protein
MSNRIGLFAVVLSLAAGLSGCSVSIDTSTRSVASPSSTGGSDTATGIGPSPSGGSAPGTDTSGTTDAGIWDLWRQGSGPVSSPKEAARLGLEAVHAHGWTWLTFDEVHIFPDFYEVEFNDLNGYKGPELYLYRSSGDLGPEMGPNMMWDTKYGMGDWNMGGWNMGGWSSGGSCGTEISESQARGYVTTTAAGVTLGDAERHHGYWEFELKRGSSVVNQVNVNNCTHAIVWESDWQPDMVGIYAPNG